MRKETQMLPALDPRSIETARIALANGGVVVFPTDTLYGLAGDYQNIQAIEKIYQAKGRSAAKALPVLISRREQLRQLVFPPHANAEKLMTRYWPGPLTLVLKKLEHLLEALTPYDGLAVRMPNHPIALKLLDLTGPLAVTSANLSDHPNPLDAQGVLMQLKGKIDLILDGGALLANTGSTIVDYQTEIPHLIRQGVIPFEQLLQDVER